MSTLQGGDHQSCMQGLAFVAHDIDKLKDSLQDLVGTVKPAVQPGRRIVTLRRRRASPKPSSSDDSSGVDISVAVAFMTPHARTSKSDD